MKTTENFYFESFIMLLIAYSTVLLVLESPTMDPYSTLGRIIEISDLILGILFVIEMIMKIVAYGLVLHKNAYLRSGWNVLDAVVVTVSLMDMYINYGGGSSGSVDISSFRALRALRALRPLRMISRYTMYTM